MASDAAPPALVDLRMLPPALRVVDLDAAGAPGGGPPMSLAASPTLTELAALAQLIAQSDPALMGPFLHAFCRSRRATTTARRRAPTDQELDVLRRMPHGAELLASSRWGAAWLEARQEATAEALDRAIPALPRAPKWVAAVQALEKARQDQETDDG